MVLGFWFVFLYLYVPDKNIPSLLWKRADFQVSQCFPDITTMLNAVFGQEGHVRFRAVGLWNPLGSLIPASLSLEYPAGGQRPLLGNGRAAGASTRLRRWRRKAAYKLHSSGNVPELKKVDFPDGFNVMELKREFCRIKLKHVVLVPFWKRKA